MVTIPLLLKLNTAIAAHVLPSQTAGWPHTCTTATAACQVKIKALNLRNDSGPGHFLQQFGILPGYGLPGVMLLHISPSIATQPFP